MKTYYKNLIGLALAAPLVACNKAEQRPNIIFFLVDDYGWAESSLAFGEEVYPMNERYHTPNMERLAKMGVMMTNAYACPVSTPTRTAMMTGMNAAHMGITSFNSILKDKPSDAIGGAPGTTNENLSDIFANPEWNHNGICPESFADEVERYGLNHTLYCTPMVEVLKDVGYFTINIGKAHWSTGGTPAANPFNLGFLINVAGSSNGHPRSYLGREFYGNTPQLWDLAAIQNMSQYYDTDVHLTDALTMEALKSLDYPIEQGIPFYLYLSHHAPHTPIQGDERFLQKYLDAGLDIGQARYASLVEGMDKSLGDVLDFVQERGIADNTIIIFMSDNGGQSVGSPKGGVPHTQNLPLREGKGSCYEGGIRIPLIFHWPGKTAADVRINTPVICEDMFATILDMAGVERYSTLQERDGESLVRLITDGSQYVAKAKQRGEITTRKQANRFVVPASVSGLEPDRELIFHYPHQWRVEDQPDIDFLSAIRSGDWKLVYRMHDAALELYNLAEDIGEQRNLAEEHPERVKAMAARLSNRLREWQAPMPTVRATGKRVPMPDEL